MGLALILFIGGAVIFAWLFFWSRQRQGLGYTPGVEQVLQRVPSASGDDAVLVSREHGQVVYANERARHWLNMNGGNPNLEYVAQLAQPSDSFLDLFAKEGQSSFQLGIRWVEASSHRIPAGNEMRTVVVMRELGANTLNPEALDLSLAMSVINEMGETVNASLSVEQVLQALLSIVRNAVPADAGEICVWDEQSQVLYPRGWVGDSTYVLSLSEAGGMYRLNEGITGWIARNRKPVLISDNASATAIPPKLSNTPYKSYVGVPLSLGDKFIGTFELSSTAVEHFSQRDMALLQAVSKQLATSIYNAQLYTEQARHIDDMASLQQVMQQTDDDYVRAVYRDLTERLAKLVGADMCGILLYNEARQMLVAELPFYGVPDQVTRNYQISIPLGSPQREVWENQQYWISNDVADEPLIEMLGLMPLVNVTGVYNTLLLPMMVGDKRIGTVQVSNKRTEGGFTLRDVQNLRILTAQAAVVVENTRLYQREQSRESELVGLQEITQAIGAFNSIEEFYQALNERIARLMGTAMSGILVYEVENNRLVAQLPFYGVNETLVQQYQIPLKPGSILYDIWLEVDYWFTNNVNSDRVVIEAGLEDMAAAVGVKQTMIAPLSLGDRRLGVVQISNKLNGEHFTDKDARLLTIFATQAAALIENARLYREMQRRADEAEGLRDAAEELRRIAELAGSIITPDEALTPVLAEVARLTDSPLVFVNVLEESSSNLVTYPGYVYGVELDEAIVQDSYTPGFDKSVALSRHPFISNNVATDERVLFSYRFIAKKVGIETALLVPLAVGDRNLGELGIANRISRPYTQDDLKLVMSIAIQISATLDRVTLYESAGQNLNQRVQELDAISRVSNELTLTLDLDRILDVIRQEAARATGADGSTVALLKPSSRWSDLSVPEISRRLGDEQILDKLIDIEREATEGSIPATLVPDYAETTLRPVPENVRSAIAAPFLFGDEIVGVIHLYHSEANHFDGRASEFLMTLASKAALGYANAIRYDEQLVRNAQLRRRVEQLNQIFELGQMLQSNTEPVTMLEAIAYSIQNSVGYDVVVMLLVDEDGAVLRRVAQAGLPLDVFEQSKAHLLKRSHLDALLSEDYHISESYYFPSDKRADWRRFGDLTALDTSFEGKRVISNGDAEAWHEGDLFVIPLTNSTGSLLGLIVLDGPHDNHSPNRGLIEVLEIFAHHASATIENTHLYLGSISSAEQEARLNEVLEAATSTLDVEEVLRAIAHGVFRLAHFTQMTAALLDADLELFDIYKLEVESEEKIVVKQETWSSLQFTALGRTVDNGQDYLYHANDKEVEQFNDLRGYCEGDHWVAIVLPLAAGGQRIGALLVGGDVAPDVRLKDVRSLVKRMANIASIAIENARLFTDAVNLRLKNESVVQSIQQGIVVLDKSGRIISVNTFMAQRYGWESEKAVGQDLFAYRPELVPTLLGDIRTALETGLPQERIGQRSTINERASVRNFYAYPLGDSSNIRGVVLMVEDVTERAQLEHDLEARANQLSVLTEVSSRITASLDHTEVVALALSEMHRIVNYDTMTFWLRDGDYIILEAAKDYEDDTMPIGVNVKIDGHARISQVVKTQKVFSISRLQGWDKLPGESGSQSWMGVPLVNQGNVVGVIAFAKIEPSFYDEQSEQAAFAFANQVAVALANADLFREAEHRTQRLSLLNRVSVALVQSLDSEDILEIALREISQVLQVEHARALIFERDVQLGRVVVEHPRGDTPPDQIIDLKDSPAYQQIRRTVKSLVIDDLVNLQGMDEVKNELSPRDITAYALIPMAIGGQVIGAFELEMFSTARRFNPEQTDLGRIIANQAAIAIQNTSLLEQTLVRSRELETLLEAAQATSVTLDLQEVFRSVVELMMHALEMDDCALMMWDDVDGTVEVQVDANRSGDESRMKPPGTLISLSDYPAKLRALEKREVIILNHESKEWYPKEYDEMMKSGVNAQMLVPLIVRDRVIGLVQMELISDYRTFTHREIRLAQALGAQAATAIENARLSTETSSRVEELYIINDLSQTVSSTINIDEMIDVVRDRLPTIAHTEELYLALYDSETKVISFPLAVRNGEAYEIPPRELNTDEISYIIKNRRLLTIGSDYFSTDELRRSLGISPGEGDVKSYMGVPLISGDEVVGVLALRDTTRTRAFGVNASGILTTIASQLGASIQNARLFNKLNILNKNLEQSVQNRTSELLEERDRIDTLYRITSELARTLDLERVLSRALEMVAGAVNAHDGVIFQIDPTTDKLNSRATLAQNSGHERGEQIDVAHPAEKLAEWLIQNQTERVVVVNDLLKMDFWDDGLLTDVDKSRSALAVLLEINDDIHGVMILFGRKRGMFTEPQVKLVVAAANQVAAAINNSDLYYLIRDQAERLGMLVLSEQEESEKSNAILEGIADGVMLANARGQIIRFNSAAERILELPRDNVLGQPLSRLSGLQGGSVTSWMRTIDEWSQSPNGHPPGTFLSEQTEMDQKVINVRLSPVHIDNQFLGTVLVFRDITKEVEVERLKGEFISNVSHELRTPLTPIKGFTDLMLLGAAGQISSQQEYFLKTIKSHTQRLETLVNDLLNISKLDDTKESLKFETVNVTEIVESVVKTVGGRADHEQKELKVSIDIPESFPTISGDSGKITQIFNNLVDNAFNYTYAGGSIDIQARVQEDGDHILVTVKDSGIGIPPEFHERIWERFVRNDEHALVMDVAGTGLGLPIVKKLVQIHQGEVWFESELNKGTTFFVSLPINQPMSN
jgi:PAS domain S-box-containing protein